MIGKRSFFFGIILGFIFSSCEKDELPKPNYGNQNSVVRTLEMGENYSSQIGFSLQNDNMFQIKSIDWDIYVYPDKQVRINTSRFMKVYKVESEAGFLNTYSDSVYVYDKYASHDFEFKIKPSTVPSYYIIDLGRDISGDVLYKVDCKMQLVEDQLMLSYRARGQVTWKEIRINLTSVSGTFFSFLQERISSNNLFVQSDFYCGGYITRFEEANLDYLVRGVLVNKTSPIEIAEVTNLDYDSVTLSDVVGFEFKQNIDQIGYDWKTYDIDAGIYITDQTKLYIVKYNNGLIYKLKFIDYHNEQGKKGYPVLSYALLE